MTTSLQTSADTRVDLTLADGVAWITLDGARTRNALDEQVAAALVSACEEIDADPSIGVAVITGANGTFCSGAGARVPRRTRRAAGPCRIRALGAVYRAFDRVGRLTVPTLARIEGAAVGAGLNLALAADLQIAATDARLISGFAPVGIHPGGGHLHLLARTAGRQTAAAMGMFARTVTGAAGQAGRTGVGCGPRRRPRRRGRRRPARRCGRDPDLARAIKASFVLTTSARDAWAAATEVERARQMWSLTRPRPTAASPSKDHR